MTEPRGRLEEESVLTAAFFGSMVRRSARVARDIALPGVCPWCRRTPVASNTDLCPSCARLFRFQPSPHCPDCGGSLRGALSTCPDCARHPQPPWDLAVVPFAFADPAREAVHRLKYHGQTWLAPALAAFMAQAWEGRGWGRPDLLVPVPLHWTKVVTRGFNQAQLLATCLGRVLDVPVANLLRRRRRTSQQARLSREQRLRNVREAFVLRRGARPAGLSIVVVDDVMTTGATLQGVTEALLEQGSGAVSILCLARAWSDSW